MKSHESDLVELAACIIRDAHSRCTATSPALRDVMTMTSRVKHEGLSFITITLPTFGVDLETGLSQGFVDSTLFRSFKKNGAIPAFMQGMLSLVFDRVTGRIFDEEVDSIAGRVIECVRQVAYAFKKLEMNCTPNRVQLTINKFAETERELSEAVVREHDIANFSNVAHVLWDDLCNIDVAQSIPRHGPGATAERISGNRKYTWQTWHERLEPYFPFLDNALVLGAYGSREFKNVTFITSDKELPVRVTPVPKTLKGPRIIAIEPVCMQYAQQAIRRDLYDHIESAPLTAGHVNFTDQSINRQLAMKSSNDCLMATLDLSDASDRVLNDLAMIMFDSNPDLKDAIQACRTTSAELPDGTCIGPLAKFASMGSALCFPVESMYFYTICVVALLEVQNLPVTYSSIRRVTRNVYIYGDDIIVQRRYAETIVDYLQKYYCKVNITKSHWNGKFRESCGMDAYSGKEVTPLYLKSTRPTSRRQVHKLVSWINSMNAFYKKGYIETSTYLQKACEKLLGKLPIVSETSPVLGRILDAPLTIGRFSKVLHRPEIRGWSASPVKSTDSLVGYGALTKCLMSQARKRSDTSYSSAPINALCAKVADDHLERSVRRGAVTLKRHWHPVY